MNRRIIVFGILLLIILVGTAGANAPNAVKGSPGLVKSFENLFQLFMKQSLPDSLNAFFSTQISEVPESGEWTQEMFTQQDALDGISTNLQEGDFPNATVSYNIFANEYKNISLKVPEWKGYFDFATVSKLGNDINAGDVNASMEDIGTIQDTCGTCHEDHAVQVWAKYYWRDFDTVNVSTSQGNMVWGDAMGVLGSDFDGLGTNLAEGKQNDALDSLNQFKTLYTNFKVACFNCHNTPRFYFVSDDVFTQINQMQQDIQSGNLQGAQNIRKNIEKEDCYRCHVIHKPAQDLKGKMGN